MTHNDQQCRSRTTSRLRRHPEPLPLRAIAPIGLIISSLLICALLPSLHAQMDSANEYELKAAMLFNLARFVDWPAPAYSDAQAPTVFCILGRDPFGKSLTSFTAGQRVNGRSLVIRYPRNPSAFRDCHLLYISSSEKKSLDQILSALKGFSVLTVGEMSQFAARGGMVQFSLEEKQVHFDINLAAASRADLKISARLLVLSRIVGEQKESGREGSPAGS